MEPCDLVVGIDLGTTNCCSAVYLNGKIKVIQNREGGRVTPSCVFFAEKPDSVIVGQYAKKMSDTKPEYGVYGNFLFNSLKKN